MGIEQEIKEIAEGMKFRLYSLVDGKNKNIADLENKIRSAITGKKTRNTNFSRCDDRSYRISFDNGTTALFSFRYERKRQKGQGIGIITNAPEEIFEQTRHELQKYTPHTIEEVI